MTTIDMADDENILELSHRISENKQELNDILTVKDENENILPFDDVDLQLVEKLEWEITQEGTFTFKIDENEYTINVKNSIKNAVIDDWADNKITSRDSFETTPYSFNTDNNLIENVENRLEWENTTRTSTSNNRLQLNVSSGCDNASAFAKNSMDSVDITNLYYEFIYEDTGISSGATSQIRLLQEDAVSGTNGDVVVFTIRQAEGTVNLGDSGGSITGEIPQSVSAGTTYGVLIQKEGKEWEIFWNPEDHLNPKDSESIGSGTGSVIPDMSEGGHGFRSVHCSVVFSINRMELF